MVEGRWMGRLFAIGASIEKERAAGRYKLLEKRSLSKAV